MKLSVAMLALALGGAAPAAARSCPGDPTQTPRCLARMVALVADHRVAERNVSPEAHLCVMWTESAFCNLARRGSRSVGFGQVVLAAQRGLFWRLAAAHDLGRPTAKQVLARDGLSVAVASLVLATGMIASGGDVDRALRAYAGPPNHEAVPSWRACEARLARLDLFARPRPLALSTDEQDAVAAALDAANRHRPRRGRADPRGVLDDARCR